MSRTLHPEPDEMQRAISVFVAGYCESRSRTWPYESVHTEGLWVMRDAERKNPKYYRKEEYIVWRVSAQQADRTARTYTRGWYFVGVVVDNDHSTEETKATWKALGYRLLATEPMFIHRLARIPGFKADVVLEPLRTQAQALAFAEASNMRPESDEIRGRDTYRQYLAWSDDTIVGWVRSIETPDGAWCSNLFVKPEWRRRGIARSLLARMLRDDRQREVRASVLLSSHTGALVYPHLGYQQCATLMIFAPKNLRSVGNSG